MHFICAIAFGAHWDKWPLFEPQTKQTRNRVFKILCHTVGNKLMKHITPRGMVQPVGESLGIFMHDRAINGCWDIPNLYG